MNIQKYTEYVSLNGGSSEVLEWCSTVLKAHMYKNGENQTEIEHILDYLSSDAAPQRLRKMSYEQASIAAEKWSAAAQKKGRDLVDIVDEDIKIIHDFGDGTKIVELLTKKAFERESFFMRHCSGNLDPKNIKIYSYRDADNEPHATFEVDKDGDEIRQIKGKGNGPIHPKYIHPILFFLKHIGMDVREHDMKNLGYYIVPDKAKNLVSMFVDRNGNPAKYTTIAGKEYLHA